MRGFYGFRVQNTLVAFFLRGSIDARHDEVYLCDIKGLVSVKICVPVGTPKHPDYEWEYASYGLTP